MYFVLNNRLTHTLLIYEDDLTEMESKFFGTVIQNSKNKAVATFKEKTIIGRLKQ